MQHVGYSITISENLLWLASSLSKTEPGRSLDADVLPAEAHLIHDDQATSIFMGKWMYLVRVFLNKNHSVLNKYVLATERPDLHV